ncbi:MAG: SDR family oxidoreductase [Planctomycetota bacterium]
MGELAAHVVVLVGATGALGSAFARHVFERGGRLAVAVRKPWQVDKLRGELGGDRLLVGVVEPGDGEAAAGFAKGAGDALGPVTALVCTSGAFAANPVGKDPAGELRELLEANLISGATLARALVPGMRRRGRGALVFVGSLAVGNEPLSANYLASKAALHEYVRVLADELAGSGVHAAAILPGTLDTEANRRAMPAADRSRWTPLATAVAALAAAAFEPARGGGPLVPLSARA